MNEMQLRKLTSLLTFTLLCVQQLKAEDISSTETSTDLMTRIDSIKNQLKTIKSDITDKYKNEKLSWQLEVLKNWYADEDATKCLRDLGYVFQDWTVIQRRIDGSENFYRNWSEYQQGFGDKKKEFFLGLEPLHQLSTKKGGQELLIILGDHDKHMVYANYDNFVLGSAEGHYELKSLGSYSGTAGDALSTQLGKKFTTLDQDNDDSIMYNCAKLWQGAWWFGFCHQSHLNGPYLDKPVSEKGERGIVWDLWHGMDYSLKFVLIMVRSKPHMN